MNCQKAGERDQGKRRLNVRNKFVFNLPVCQIFCSMLAQSYINKIHKTSYFYINQQDTKTKNHFLCFPEHFLVTPHPSRQGDLAVYRPPSSAGRVTPWGTPVGDRVCAHEDRQSAAARQSNVPGVHATDGKHAGRSPTRVRTGIP